MKHLSRVAEPFVVTGAGGGIGAATVTALRESGRTVIGADLEGRGADIDLDVTDASAVEGAINRVVGEHGGLGGVVTAAGVGVGGPLETLDLETWRRAIDVNLWGTVHVVRSAYPHLITAAGGHIVLLASLSGLTPTPLLVPYATTKWALVGLARSLAPEARGHGVGVTAICPGPVETPMLDAGHEFTSVTGGFDARRYLTNAAGPALPPSKVAEAVVKSIGTRRVVVSPGRARMLARFGAISPNLTAKVIGLAMQKELQQMRDAVSSK